MASPSAILATAKAARTVPHQQGNGVLAVPGGNATYGGIYAANSMLPRPPDDFTVGAFTPLDPIYPYPIDQPPPGLDRPMPRRRPYQVGENLPGAGERTNFGLISFQGLRSLSLSYSVARACIQLLKSEIRGLEWDIVPTKDAAKAMRGDYDAMKDFGERRSKVIRFFKNPDPEYGSWTSWIDTLLEDIYAIDAASIYLRPSRLPGRGLLGSDLSALEPIAGESIRPLVDVHGGRPSPPAPAWQQYVFGVPRTDNISIMMGLDLPEGMSEAKVRDYRGDQMLYLPYTRRTTSPYGMPPIEQALVPVTNGLAKQAYQSEYFSSSSIPQVYISPGDQSITASQVKELQEAFNIISGDLGYKFKVVVLPPGSKPFPMKDPVLADAFDAIVMTEVCMAFMVQPTELGIMPQVAAVQTPSSVNMANKASNAIHQRKSLVPMLQFLKENLLDKVIQVVCRQHDMQFMFDGLEEDEDEATLTNLIIAQIGAGLCSVDEGRAEIGRDPWGLEVTQDPLWASANGVMLLGSVDPATGQPAGQQAALPSVGQQMSGAIGGSSSGQANEGQVNPKPALAQGHMPGTTHVPPAQANRKPTPAHAAAVAGASEAAARTATSTSKSATAGHRYQAIVPGNPGACKTCGDPRSYAVHALSKRAAAATAFAEVPAAETVHVITDLLTASGAASLGETALKALAADDTEAFQDRGEPVRQRYGIDGTAGDAMDEPHPFTADKPLHPDSCVACGMGRHAGAHKCQCCAGAGEHPTGHECYKCDAGMYPSPAEWAEPDCARVFRDPKLHAKGCPNCGKPPFLGSGTSPKAVLSELEALGRHIRKGRDPATWRPVHIPGALMASISEDLTKGLDAAEVLTAAVASLPKFSVPSASGPYATEINAAFGQVQAEARALFSQFLNGSLPVSAKVLASMIADLILSRLTDVLGHLYVAGFTAGYQSGLHAASLPPAAQSEAQALARQEMAAWSRQAAIRTMSMTGMAGLAAAILVALLAGTATVAALMALLAGILTASRADLIAVTEWQKAFSDGESAAYARAGVGYVRWVTRNDAKVCAKCAANQAAGPWPVSRRFPSGTLRPPQHPNCRCRLVVSEPPPVTIGKAAKEWDWKHPDTSLPVAEQVYRQLLEDFPPEAIEWVKRAKWSGPEQVPLKAIEYQPSKWQAGHEPGKVERFRRKIVHRVAKGKIGHKPAILVDRPDTERGTHIYVVDGHHRVVADHELNRPVDAYVGIVDAEDVKAAQETHSSQKKEGDPGASDTAAKSFTAGALGDGSVHGLVPFDLAGPKPPVASGIAVRAADTGRVLMLQRGISEDDPAAGHWEMPGGCLDEGESPRAAAEREWAEEVGMPLPDGEPGGMWASRNGAYHGFILTVPSEFPVHEGRDQVTNPDDPDGDQVEAIAWWDVSQLPGNPALRRELAGDLDLVMNALAAPPAEKSARGRTSAEVLREYWTHEGHPGPTQYALEEKIRWGEPNDWYRCVDELTPYIGAEGAKGYCNLRHHEVLGFWPGHPV